MIKNNFDWSAQKFSCFLKVLMYISSVVSNLLSYFFFTKQPTKEMYDIISIRPLGRDPKIWNPVLRLVSTSY